MVKDAFYFSHDYNSRNDQKILLLRSKYHAEGYGIFWMLIEIMAESTLPHINHSMIPAISVALNINQERLKEIIDFCIEDCRLFVSDGVSFTSLRLIRHRQFREEFKEAGLRGAIKRWSSPPISPPISGGNAKERKEKEIKGNNIYATIFEELWNKYPKRIGKKHAKRHFESTVKTDEDVKAIQIALNNYLSSERVMKGFIQNGSTWFNQWQDWVEFKEEICPKCKNKGKYISSTGYEIVCDCPRGKA